MLNKINAIPTVPVKVLKAARDLYQKKLGLEPIGRKDDEHVQLFRSGKSTVEVYTSEYAGTNKGVYFEHYTLPETKVDGDIHIMGDMKAAWFKDPDGNILCIHNH